MHKAKSMVTYIQTDYKGQPIKVKPAKDEFCAIHLKKPGVSSRYYTIIPEPYQMPAHFDRTNRWRVCTLL